MKTLVKICSSILLISSLLVFSFGCKKETLVTADNPFGLAGMNVRPEAAALTTFTYNDGTSDVTINPTTDIVTGEDAIAYAVALYDLACYNDKRVACRASFNMCDSSFMIGSMDNKVKLNIFETKNGTEYYRIDYRLKDDIPLFVNPALETSINNAITLVCTERRYTNTSMDYTKYEQVKNAKTDENGIPYADWTQETKSVIDPTTNEAKPKVFNAAQTGDYYKTDFIVELDTVKSASVAYDEVAGTYSVSIELNVELDENGYNKASELTSPLIKNGSGDENAHYTSVVVNFVLWDNGYFKEFDSEESWVAKVTIINFTSTFYYHEVFSYDPDDCDISKYYTDGDFVDNYND